MENGALVDSEPCGGGGNKVQKGKMVKRDNVGGAPKKMLADITNLQQENLNPSNQHAKKQPASPAAYNCSDQLLKEKALLMKLLASRNAVIESSKAELQKLQSNFQKLQTQNAELARAYSQMMGQRELQLELGCKNGILKAMQLKSKSPQSDQTFQADRRGDNLCKAKRRTMSKSQSSETAVIKRVNSTEKVDNQRYCLRGQSMGLKSDSLGPTEDAVDDTKSCVSHLQENLAKRKRLISSGSTVQEENREETECSGPSTIEQVHAKEDINMRRKSSRRQSARFKPEVPVPTEETREDTEASGRSTINQVQSVENIDDRRKSSTRQSARLKVKVSEPTEETREDTESSGPSTINQVHTVENIDNERRQSVRSKTEDPEPIEDSFQIDDNKFSVFHLCDNVVNRSETTTSSMTSGQESNEENNSLKFGPQEVRRSSVGRPLRRAAGKVLTYKELPRNTKMRRPN
ncbi:SHUGOSHIN 2-like [Senna tora]|uniref:SHUGOSHIN 2-like n=1 Tax=Senna tora TaxID=362788 RepID=A0A834WC13_9FABA|nr:SHUGOSHIN 2-like [Senna tora]